MGKEADDFSIQYKFLSLKQVVRLIDQTHIADKFITDRLWATEQFQFLSSIRMNRGATPLRLVCTLLYANIVFHVLLLTTRKIGEETVKTVFFSWKCSFSAFSIQISRKFHKIRIKKSNSDTFHLKNHPKTLNENSNPCLICKIWPQNLTWPRIFPRFPDAEFPNKGLWPYTPPINLVMITMFLF